MKHAKTLDYGFSSEEYENRLERAQDLLYQKNSMRY